MTHINKILFVQPPCTITRAYTKEIQPPLGLAYIAAVLEGAYEVAILDAAVEGWERESPASQGTFRYGLADEEIKSRIAALRPDVVGVSCLFSLQAANAHRVCRLAKEVDSRIITLMGGAHPTVMPEHVLRDTAVDYVVIGEGEETTRLLLECLRKNADVGAVAGVAYRHNDLVTVIPKTNFIQDLDTLPFPARHLLPMEKYFRINMPHGVTTRRSPNTSLISSRGCPAQCVFCSIHPIWGKTFRARSPENVLAEIRHLRQTYGVRELQFEDDNLTFDRARAGRIFELMSQPDVDMLWTTPNGVAMWALDEELLLKMRQSGCYRLSLAIESGDQEVLRNIIRKPLDLDKARRLITFAKNKGFETDAFFVVGFPGETRTQIRRTFRFGRSLPVDSVHYYAATPYPGTPLYDICRQAGCLAADFDVTSLGVKNAVIRTPEFTPVQLERMIAREKLLFRLMLLWRDPRAFYVKVIRRFWQDPVYVLNLIRDIFRKLTGRRA